MIKIKDLIHKYTVWESETEKSKKTVLDGISLDIPSGQFVAILGANGSGKSTLAKHLNVLLLPDEGTVWIDGKKTEDRAALWEIREKVGMVFQNPDNQIIGTSVEEDVAFGPENKNLEPNEIQKRVTTSLKEVGLLEKRKASPFRLSGGQKQRVAIAGVLAMEPEVLILDEPTAGLDPAGRDEILFKIKDMHERLNMTVILVSHSMEDIAKLADRILVMNQGRVAMFDKTDAIFKRGKELTQIGLNVPQITRIADQLREHHIPLREGIYTVEDACLELCKLLKLEGNHL